MNLILRRRLDYSTTNCNIAVMTSLATGLSRALPKPKYNSEYEEQKAQQRGPRIVGAGQLDETQVVLKVGPLVACADCCDRKDGADMPVFQRSGPPEYPNRAGWRPRAPEDFGDGGAFPEIPVAQYPWGQKNATKSNALVVQVDGEGKVDYSAIARQGHSNDRVIHTSFKELIPLRQRAEAGDLDLSRPSQEQVAETAERTRKALEALVSGAVASQKPKNVNVGGRRDPTFVRYTPSAQMGDNSKKQDRIMKIVERQRGESPVTRLYTLAPMLISSDPMEPPKFKHKKIPRGPPTPPPPVRSYLRSSYCQQGC